MSLEAERQRQAAEAAAAAEQARAEHSAERAAQAAAAGGGGGGYGADGAGGGGGAAAAYAEAAGGAHSKYPNSALPVAERGQENEPLVGAVAAPLDYTVPPQTKVAARPPGQKEWLLCTVQSANPIVGKYVVEDDDEPEVAGAPHEQYQVISRCVLPLPLYEPQAFTPYNEHRMGATVLALYPDTTCFYKAWVYTPPSERRRVPATTRSSSRTRTSRRAAASRRASRSSTCRGPRTFERSEELNYDSNQTSHAGAAAASSGRRNITFVSAFLTNIDARRVAPSASRRSRAGAARPPRGAAAAFVDDDEQPGCAAATARASPPTRSRERRRGGGGGAGESAVDAKHNWRVMCGDAACPLREAEAEGGARRLEALEHARVRVHDPQLRALVGAEELGNALSTKSRLPLLRA